MGCFIAAIFIIYYSVLCYCQDCSLCQRGPQHCQLNSGIFMKPYLKPGYTTITTIPKGACQLNIQQLNPTNNHIGLMTLDGSTFNISSTEPLQEPLNIVIYSVERNQGVKYEYKIPISKRQNPVYQHDLPESDYHVPVHVSQRNIPISQPNIPVSRHNIPVFQHNIPVSQQNIPVSQHNIPVSQKNIPISQHNVPTAQDTSAVSQKNFTFSQYTSLSLRKSNQQKPVHKSKSKKKQKKGKGRLKWELSGYTSCSVSCGEGVELALFECVRVKRKTRKVVKEKRCRKLSLPEIPPSRVCQQPTCHKLLNCAGEDCLANRTGTWNIGTWSRCSVPCGDGIRTRSVDCISNSNRAVIPETECNGAERPPVLSTCTGIQCSQNHWLFTEWEGKCNNDEKVKQRSIICLEEKCGEAPSSIQACSKDMGEWFTGPWTECSVTCGEGVKFRSVVCISEKTLTSIAQTKCDEDKKPKEIEPCYNKPTCPPTWLITEWTQGKCDNADCLKRQVTCFNERGQISTKCPNSKPRTELPCSTHNCDITDIYIENNENHRSNPETSHQQRHKQVSDKRCQDKDSKCPVVVRARLCRLKYYSNVCCHSCSIS